MALFSPASVTWWLFHCKEKQISPHRRPSEICSKRCQFIKLNCILRMSYFVLWMRRKTVSFPNWTFDNPMMKQCGQWFGACLCFISLNSSNAWAEKYFCVNKPHLLTPGHRDPVVHPGRMRRYMLNGSGICRVGRTWTVSFICQRHDPKTTANSPQQSYYSVIANLLYRHCESLEA